MFDFDDYESLNDYEFYYPITDILENQYHLYKRKKEKGFLPYEEWVYKTVYGCVIRGLNKFGEVEHELDGREFAITDVDSTEFFIGAVYKFGL